jgi:hypothetical protein
MWQNRAILYQTTEAFLVDANGKEIKQSAYMYSREQRYRARPHYEGALVGLITHMFTDPLLNIMPHEKLLFCRLRHGNTIFVAFEQSLLPAACYAESKKIIDYCVPDMHKAARFAGAVAGAFVGAGLFVVTGASPERLALASYLYHVSSDTANKKMYNPIIGPVTQSVASAARIMPVVQAAGGLIDCKPGWLTLHPLRDPDTQAVDRSAEMAHAIVPVLIHTGVDLGVDLITDKVSKTDIGKKINHEIDKKLHPILGEEGTEDAKQVAKGFAKVGITIGVVHGLGAAAQAGCTIL